MTAGESTRTPYRDPTTFRASLGGLSPNCLLFEITFQPFDVNLIAATIGPIAIIVVCLVLVALLLRQAWSVLRRITGVSSIWPRCLNRTLAVIAGVVGLIASGIMVGFHTEVLDGTGLSSFTVRSFLLTLLPLMLAYAVLAIRAWYSSRTWPATTILAVCLLINMAADSLSFAILTTKPLEGGPWAPAFEAFYAVILIPLAQLLATLVMCATVTVLDEE